MDGTSPPEPRRPRPADRVTVEIAGRTLLLLAAFLALIWLGARLSHLLLILLFAILLATAIDEPVSWLERRGVPRPFGILLHYLALLALFALVALVLIPVIGSEVRLLRAELPAYGARIGALLGAINPDWAGGPSLDRVADEATGNVGQVASRLTALSLDVARTLLYVFITFVLAFFLAVEPDLLGRLASRFVAPHRRDQILALAAESRDRIGAWARGQLLIALIFGALMGLGLELIGVPYAVSLGTTAGVLELVPYVGGAVTVTLAAVVALGVGVPQVVGVIVLYLVLVNLESHVLAPLLFGKAVGLPPVAILIALLAGVELLGIAGALLAVPATVIVWVVVDALWPHPTDAEALSAPPPAAPPPPDA